MNILIIGSGGREHALAWKIAQSPLTEVVWCAPGSPAMDQIGPCFDVAADDVKGLHDLALQLEPDLIVIGPEAPLAGGLADGLRARGFDVFGPGAEGAKLEASKGFAKDFMARLGVPTAMYRKVTDLVSARAFFDSLPPPYVIKADGLAGGKGVVIAPDVDTAIHEAGAMLSGKFSGAGTELVLEEFMHGEEASVFVLTDGVNRLTLPACQDHKRLLDGDEGPNTGGMGAYAPAPVMTPELLKEVDESIAAPIIDAMAQAGFPYQGVLYIGLMITPEGPKVVEFNVRFGDPECQVLMMSLADDIVPALLACATGGMPARDFARLEKGSVIKGLKAAGAVEGVMVFHAGTGVNDEGEWIAAGGRVLTITAAGDTLEQAVSRAYEAVDLIDWPQGVHRRDIAWRALAPG